MKHWTQLICVSLVAGLAGTAAAEPTDAQVRDAATSTRETVLPGGLQVEKLVRRADGVFELSYRLIGVSELPDSPFESYVLDPVSGARAKPRRVPILPATEHDPDKAPLATLLLYGEEGRSPDAGAVTVVVAGLRREGIALEKLGEAGSAQASAGKGATPVAPAPAAEGELDVLKLMLTAGGALLDLRYRISGVDRVLPADRENTYILDPDTGERFYVLGVTRIGTLATKTIGARTASYLLADNSRRKLGEGDRVTVVVAGLTREDVLVER